MPKIGMSWRGLRCLWVVLGIVGCVVARPVWAQQEISAVEINGDQVEYMVKENKVVATGNVVVSKADVRLLADRIEFYRGSQDAVAIGNVVLERGESRVSGTKMTFNFQTMKGDFDQPNLVSPPLFGKGESVERIDEGHYLIRNGYITTSDFDEPETRVTARTVDVYPNDRAVLRNVSFKVGRVPVFYLPRYTYDLDKRKPTLILTPGYSGDWGGFVLGRYHYTEPENYDLVFHADYRERKGMAWGVDDAYRTDDFGSGLLRTYYIQERDIGHTHFWDEHPSVNERDRYKVDWRHKWQADERTMVIAQASKMNDRQVLKDYFDEEYDDDARPASYVVATHRLPYGTLIGRTDYRLNDFYSGVERLPEAGYVLTSTELLDSGLYYRNSTTYSRLVEKEASPSDVDYRTDRLDLNHSVSYPMKVSVVELSPFVGARHTYYSRTAFAENNDAVRGILETGVDASTKFYRVYDVESDLWGLDIDQLRHVITPSAAYLYRPDPTVSTENLYQIDGVDALTHRNRIQLALENKLQTKRDKASVDLLRTTIATDFRFREEEQNSKNSSWDNVTLDVEVTPYRWLGIYFDGEYDVALEDVETANFDLYINGARDVWYLRFGNRYAKDVDNQVDAEFGLKINPKWEARVRQCFDTEGGRNQEREFGLRRDLHTWFMDMTYTKTKFDGEEVWLMFSLKEFPDLRLSGGTSWAGGAERPGDQP